MRIVISRSQIIAEYIFGGVTAKRKTQILLHLKYFTNVVFCFKTSHS